MRWVLIGVSRDIEFQLRNDIFAHLERLPMRFYQRNRTGDLISRATNDLSNVRMVLGPGIMYTANTLIVATFAVALMLSIDWKLTLMALLPLPIVTLSVWHFGKRIHELSQKAQERLADLSARVQESLSGIRVVKAFVQEKHEIQTFETMNRALFSQNMGLIRVSSLFHPTMQFTIGLAMVFVLGFGGRQVVLGNVSLGGFVAFTVYMGMLTWPMIALGWVVNLLERGRASMERLKYILDEEPEITDSPAAVDFEIEGSVEFRDLNFSYNGVPVLKGISLAIPKGKTVAIVGPTGSGKSTLVGLIPRLYNAPARTLFIDGVPIESIPLQTLRRAIGFIPQDTFLFGETVGENIAFGLENAVDADIERATHISNIYDDIQEFPSGFRTMVGERGITLSGGQKQRTAISRAVVRNPKVLILDDSLSSVDTYTEERILNELRDVTRERTSILISHRVSTVKTADEIVVLDCGEIIERGTHDELLERRGHYAELYRKQLLEEELAIED